MQYVYVAIYILPLLFVQGLLTTSDLNQLFIDYFREPVLNKALITKFVALHFDEKAASY